MKIRPEDLEKLAYGGEYLPVKEEPPKEEPRVDMWDQAYGSEGTVSHAVRRYTAQWGLPTMLDP